MKSRVRLAGTVRPGVAILTLLLLAGSTAIAQSDSSSVAGGSHQTDLARDTDSQSARWYPPAYAQTGPNFSRFGVGAKISTLGVGLEAATSFWGHTNLRVGGNFFNYSYASARDGFNTRAALHFRSVETSLDWFPFGNGFRVSPGAILYSSNRVTATPNVNGGQHFQVDNADYWSSVTDPIRGNAKLEFPRAAPTLTVGWGNMVPRNEHRFSFPVELGFAYVGEPPFSLRFTGSVCNSKGLACHSINTDPIFQSKVLNEQRRVQSDVSPFRFFPIVSTGIAMRF